MTFRSEVQTDKPFPKLMIGIGDAIVFFIKPGYGFVLREGGGSKYDDPPHGWVMSNFTDYNEPITLQNV